MPVETPQPATPGEEELKKMEHQEEDHDTRSDEEELKRRQAFKASLVKICFKTFDMFVDHMHIYQFKLKCMNKK